MKKALSLLLALALLLSLCPAALAAGPADVTPDEALKSGCAFLLSAVPEPGVEAVGGDWIPFLLARAGYDVPEAYLTAYRARVEAKAAETAGILHRRKYSDNSRVILALTALGTDPRDVAGYDLTAPLADVEKTAYQGLNGVIWALIALDSAGYDVAKAPEGATQATRQLYLGRILSAQLLAGGWALSDEADVDLTAMALQALAPYREQPEVAAAVERGLAWLSSVQEASGGFVNGENENAESVSQVILALCALGMDPLDSRFVKNGHTLLEALMAYRLEDGSFRHLAGTLANLMATQQALLALCAVCRRQAGLTAVYDLREVIDARAATVQPCPVVAPGKSFADAADHPARRVIEALAERGIINGMTDTSFAPDETMTRAQFAAITVRGLGLVPKANYSFIDVPDTAWYAPYIGTANRVGIVNGVSANEFAPAATITRQEAAVMVARAAKLCGFSGVAGAEALISYADAGSAAAWAFPSLAFCAEQGLLPWESALEPKQPILRWEIAEMLYRLLWTAGLMDN